MESQSFSLGMIGGWELLVILGICALMVIGVVALILTLLQIPRCWQARSGTPVHPTVKLTACPRCGIPLTPDAPQGLCPRCVMRVGIGTRDATDPAFRDESGKPNAPDPAALAAHFPQLEIIELLGQGGMGAVYKARQKELDRLVALKILPGGAGRDPAFAERFTREARALARLNHPNIVAVHEFGQIQRDEAASPAPGVERDKEGQPAPALLYYFVMEFIDGPNLRQLMQGRKLSPREAMTIVPKICEALQFAHDEGIIHRDIKPENILLDKKGRVKIADFGIAKIVGKDNDGTLTGAKDVIGTPHYMAPEQVEKPTEVDHRADIYSLGVVFYEILTGELPLGKFALPSHKVQVDARLDEVVLHSLEKEPARRYQHASEVKTDVETIAAGAVTGVESASGERRPVAAAQLDGRRKALLWYGFITSLIGLPVGLDLGLPFVWGPSIAGLVISGVKLGFTGKSFRRNNASVSGDMNEKREVSPSLSTWTSVARWTARILGTLLLVFYATFILVEGLPPISSQPGGVQLNFIALGLMLGGFAVGWKREGTAALLIASGWILWHISEGRFSWNLFQTPLPVAALYAFCWWVSRGRKTGVLAMAVATLAVILGLGRLFVPANVFVRGVIRDAATGGVITNANLVIAEMASVDGDLDSRPNARSDQDGRFRLYVGWYDEQQKVAIAAPGYITLKTNLGPRSPGQRNLNRDFQLEPEAEASDAIARISGEPVNVTVEPEGLVVEALPDHLWRALVKFGNHGGITSPAFSVLFYAGDPRESGRLISRNTAGPVRPGETMGEVNLPFALGEDEKDVFAVIDPENVLQRPAESKELILQTPAKKPQSPRQDIEEAFGEMKGLAGMEPNQRYTLDARGEKLTGANDDFLRRRTAEEILASGLSCGCGDHATAFISLLEARGLETLWVEGVELSSASLKHRFSGHVVVAVRDDAKNQWLLVDPTSRSILSENWSRDAQTFPLNYWIGFVGPLKDYPARTPEELRSFYDRTLKSIPAEVLDREITRLNFVVDGSLLATDGTCLNPNLAQFLDMQARILVEHGIHPERKVSIRLVKGGDDARSSLAHSDNGGWECTIGLQSACSVNFLSHLEREIARNKSADNVSMDFGDAMMPPPVVVSTLPESGTLDVDPALTELRVTFSKPMQTDSWAWCKLDDATFPDMSGEPHYLEDERTCVLPVKLRPGRTYATWINVDQFQDFKDRDGHAAVPYLLVFQTRRGAAPETSTTISDAPELVTVGKDGGTQFSSIQDAIDAVAEGGTVQIGAGRYAERLEMDKSLRLVGAGWEKTVIGPTNLWSEPSSEQMREMEQRFRAATSDRERAILRAEFSRQLNPPVLSIHRANDAVLEGLKFTQPGVAPRGKLLNGAIIEVNSSVLSINQCAVVGSPYNGVVLTDGSEAKIHNSLIAAMWNRGVSVANGSKAEIRDSDIRNCYYAGVTIGRSSDATIEGCRISGSAWHGIRYDDASPLIERNHIFQNARSGIYASGRTGAQIRQNLLHGNEMNGLSCWFENQDLIEANTFVNNQREALSILGAAAPTVQSNLFSGHPVALYQGRIEDDQGTDKLGQPLMRHNVFWSNATNWARVISTDEKGRALPEVLTMSAEARSQVEDFPTAIQQGFGAPISISSTSPWPLQPEEEAIIPDGATRDSTQWKRPEP